MISEINLSIDRYDPMSVADSGSGVMDFHKELRVRHLKLNAHCPEGLDQDRILTCAHVGGRGGADQTQRTTHRRLSEELGIYGLIGGQEDQ